MHFSSLAAKLSVLAIATVASSVAIGCSDTNTGPTTGGSSSSPGSNSNPNPNAGAVPQGFELTCRASVAPVTFDFQADGSSLTMTAAGQSQTLTRAGGTSGTSIYGTWTLPTAINGDASYIARMGLAIHATAVITSMSITAVSDCSSNWATLRASVSSPITVAGSTLSILEAHQQDRKWTVAGGDEVVSTTSFHPFGEAPAAATESVLEASFPAF